VSNSERAIRAEWQYDSTAPEQNIYYWYEGNSAGYPLADGGYLDNGSSGYRLRVGWVLTRNGRLRSTTAWWATRTWLEGARLLKQAGFDGDEPLQMDWFSGALYATQYNQVVFHESHDEAGNAPGTARTVMVAVNGAPLLGATRDAAEARSRVCFGLSLFSAATPMFFMAEEIAAQKLYTYTNFLSSHEDILAEQTGNGQRMSVSTRMRSRLAGVWTRLEAATSTSFIRTTRIA
jgi:hypothetical protein